jgi:hypothetical protein
MTAGAATGVPREVPILWAILVGALAYGALVTLAMGNRTRSIVGGHAICSLNRWIWAQTDGSPSGWILNTSELRD